MIYKDIICKTRLTFSEVKVRLQSTVYGAKAYLRVRVCVLLTEAYSWSSHAPASRWDPVDVVVVGGSPFLPVSVERDRY